MKNQPLYIYLDQNQWIYLARADHNHKDGKNSEAILSRLRYLVDDEKVRLPLSAYHLLETAKIQDIEQKIKLSETMSSLSRGWWMALYDDVLPREIEIAAARFFEQPVPDLPKVFKRDPFIAFGINTQHMAQKIIERNEEKEELSEILADQTSEVFATVEMTKALLTGSIFSDIKLSHVLRGYKFGISKFAALNKKVRSMVKPEGRNQSQQKRIFIRDFVRHKETSQILNNGLSKYGKTSMDVVSLGENREIDFIESIPTLNLEAELVTMRNVQWDREIEENDWADMRSLVVAIPYSDFVVTENFWRDLICRRKLDRKYETTVLRNVNELLDCI